MLEEEELKILIIDDDKADRMEVRRNLERVDHTRFEIEEAVDRKSGIAALQKQRFDCLLLDYRLPDADGMDVLRQLVSDMDSCPPIIMLTVVDDEDIGIRAVSEGAQDYLIKGRTDGSLLSRSIRYALERKKIARGLVDYAEGLETLAKQLQAINNEMAEDLALAREIQEALVPHDQAQPGQNILGANKIALEHIYRPCKSLGGDFFDVFKVSDTEIGIFLGDVMGHGIRAALVAAVTRGILEVQRHNSNDPSRILAGLNDGLVQIFNPPNRLVFVSAICLVLNVETGHTRFSNSGHPHPIFIRQQNNTTTVAKPGSGSRGPALGVFASKEYSTTETTLNEGDRVILFTDGLTEAQDPQGREYGESRLLELIKERPGAQPLKQLVADLVHGAEKFSYNGEINDDLCVVGLERLNPDTR